jgi:hypothetical protein
MCAPDIDPIVYTKKPRTTAAVIGVAITGLLESSVKPTNKASTKAPKNSTIIARIFIYKILFNNTFIILYIMIYW